MRTDVKDVMKLFAVVGAVALGSITLSAQGGRPGRPGGPGGPGIENPDGGVSPADVQRMFDAYALMQAQEQLKISDEQFAQFLTRYKALQDVRRRTLQEHTRIVIELRRILNRNQQEGDAMIRDRLKSLDEIDGRLAADVKKAYGAIDQILDIRQQAKFRVFEENMERRKLDLVTRARQANRPKL
jgi:Spy/CpxP family protein refolding chaperone